MLRRSGLHSIQPYGIKPLARFDRKAGLQWEGREALPAHWYVNIGGVRMKLAATDFGHVGLFPETRAIGIGSEIPLRKLKNERPLNS